MKYTKKEEHIRPNIKCYICDIVQEHFEFQDLQKVLKDQHDCNKSKDVAILSNNQNYHICNICGNTFDTKELKLSHITRKHTKKLEIKVKKLIQCDTCDKFFECKSKMIYHKRHYCASKQMSKQNKLDVSHQCKFCSKTFDNKLQHNVHQRFCDKNNASIKNVDSNKSNDIVSIEDDEEIKIIDSIFQTSKLQKYVCKPCGKSFDDADNFGNHFEASHSEGKSSRNDYGTDSPPMNKSKPQKMYFCTYCSLVLEETKSLIDHVNIHHVEKQVKSCDICEHVSLTLSSKTNHMKTVHNEDKQFACEFCKTRFQGGKSLKRHILTNHFRIGEDNQLDGVEKNGDISKIIDINTVPDECDMDIFSDDDNASIDSNEQAENISDDEEDSKKGIVVAKNQIVKDERDITNKSEIIDEPSNIANEDISEIEAETETKSSIFQCNNCKLDIETSCEVISHIDSKHFTDQFSLQCDLCDYKALTAQSRIGHMRFVHKELNSFKCEFCQERHLNKNLLRIHILKDHFEINDHECSNCGIIFAQDEKLSDTEVEQVPEDSSNTETINVDDDNQMIAEFDDDSSDLVKCLECNNFYENAEDMKRHAESEHLQNDQTPGSIVIDEKTNENTTRNLQTNDVQEESNMNDKTIQTEKSEKSGDTESKNDLEVVKEKKMKKKTYKCSICSRSFRGKELFKCHVKGIHVNTMENIKSKSFKCDICSKKCQSSVVLLEHILGKHFKIKMYYHKCKQCGETFTRWNQLKKHQTNNHSANSSETQNKIITTSHQDAKFTVDSPCDIDLQLPNNYPSDNSVESYDDMDIDTLESSANFNNVIQCEVCNETFKSSNYLIQHIQSLHIKPKTLKCNYCGNTFDSEESTRNHVMDVHADHRLFNCDFICEKRFHSHIDTFVHIMKSHFSNINLDAEFTNFENDLQEAIENLFEDVNSIEQDGESSTSLHSEKQSQSKSQESGPLPESNPKEHVIEENFSPKISLKNYECKICSKTFLGTGILIHHVRSVHLNSKSNMLKYHMEKRTWVRQFKCDFCIKILRNSTELLLHILPYHFAINLKKLRFPITNQKDSDLAIVSGVSSSMEKPNLISETFTCPLCRNSFTNVNVTLADHLKVVHKAKSANVQCHLCLETFETSDALNSHIVRRHQKCGICNANFQTPQELQIHYKGENHKSKVQQKPKVCSICKVEYSNFYAHFKIAHTNVKLFKSNKDRQKTIMNGFLHTSNTDTCPMCNKKIDNLPDHLKLKHGLDLTRTITIE